MAGRCPVRRFDLKNNGTVVNEPTTQGRSAIISHKLDTIILPRVEFRDATIREAIDFLKKKSVELDPAKEGVNIVLHLEGGGGGGAAPAPEAAPSGPVIPGLDTPAPAPTAPGCCACGFRFGRDSDHCIPD